MAESTSLMKSKFESIREWIVENKLRAVGGLWAGGVIGSLAYNWSQPGKPSVKIIHARLHAQALTLAALAGAAMVEYYDHNNNKSEKTIKNREQRFPKFLPNLDRKD
ncbi:Hypoxia-responsive family protein [Perilla frutescens var. hirtella]|uniref:Hypoxia-responsive family protein n=1 Tax=Perilla frutescens var. hirtella TaxID=608512 RepID=A0AAD4J3K8_PERFH|nr:Hypoxia-responsive family protein [Perilla frutescens var. hirtella]KAH6805818.1 Hypoxia-responsive family protein [Perilla frutescens var. frutescens]KAH6826550.1 Hypoxia-responsive family protein [Perilla frutescens var. hirtella]